MRSIIVYTAIRKLIAIISSLLCFTFAQKAFCQSEPIAVLTSSEVIGSQTLDARAVRMPHDCYLEQVAFPDPPFRLGCGSDYAEYPCSLYDCPNCYNFALKLHCDSCWIEDITFWFEPADECFVMCSKANAPNTPDLGIRPARAKTCSKLEAQFVDVVQGNSGSWANQVVMAFQICRGGVGPRTLHYSATVLCADYVTPPPPPPIPHTSITGTITLP